jgi:hypothetical protein
MQPQINSQRESSMPPRPVDFDPEEPLRNAKHEHFARLRALLVPALHAAREAGYDQMTPGNAAKLDRRKDIRARITALSGMDEQMIREKRSRIEARLMAVIEADILRDFAIIEMRGRDGKQVGEIVGIDWAAVRASDSSSIVSRFKFDAKTGKLVDFERDDVLNAIGQLRDMYGFKSPTVQKTQHSFDGHGDKLDAALARLTHDDQKILAAAIAEIEGPLENGGAK